MMTGRIKLLSKEKRLGFTLVEVLIYLAILMLISASAISLLLSLDDLIIRRQAEQTLAQNASFVLEKILQEIRAADYVNFSAIQSKLVDAPGYLILVSEFGTTEIYQNGDEAYIKKAGLTDVPLTDDLVTVEDLRFYRYDSGVSEFVRARVRLRVEIEGIAFDEVFYTGAVLRNSYE